MGRLAGFVHVVDGDGAQHALGPDDEVPAWAEQAIANPKAWADEATRPDAAAAGPDAPAYRGMKIADLRAEIERRNAGRDDDAKLPAEGAKADLAAVLEADDHSE